MRFGPARLLLAMLVLAMLTAGCAAARAETAGVKVASSGPLDLAPIASDSPALPAAAEILLPSAQGDPTSPFSRASRQPTLFRWPERFWAKNYRATNLWSGPEPDASSYAALPEWSWLEFMGEQHNGRLFMRYPGDGRSILPREAWVAATDVMVAESPSENDIPRAFPATLRPDALRLQVPYRSQLDDTPWAAANCGPTTLAMVLESLGVEMSSGDLRKEVLDAQGMWGDEAGVLMEPLARVGERHGAQVLRLFNGTALKRWSPDDVRAQVQSGHPVMLQVLFRVLPGREESPYYGDHFVVITGLIDDDFLYNDPIDSDGVGYDRIMSSAQLQRAMKTSDRRYANAGFAVAKP